MSVDILRDELKNGVFRKVYYICGNEPYLKHFYFSQIKKAALADGDPSVDMIEFDGQSVTANDLFESLSSFPVTSEKKVVTVTDPLLDGEAVAYLEKNADILSDTGVLVFFNSSESAESKNEAAKRFFAFISSNGLEVRADKPERRILYAWIAKQLRMYGKTVTQPVAEYILTNVGDSMFTLSGELRKLASYCTGDITEKDVDAVCTKTEEARTFDFADAVMSKNAASAYKILGILEDTHTEAGMVAGAIFTAVGNVFKIKLAFQSGCPQKQVASKLGMKDFVFRKYSAFALKTDMKTLYAMVDGCVAADIDMKSSSASEPYLPLTKLVALLCSL